MSTRLRIRAQVGRVRRKLIRMLGGVPVTWSERGNSQAPIVAPPPPSMVQASGEPAVPDAASPADSIAVAPPEPAPAPQVIVREPYHLFVPPLDEDLVTEATGAFMPYSTCSAADFMHPDFLRIVRALDEPARFHRKQWEFVYIVHQLERLNIIGPGRRGLGFGVGSEPLPAYFASIGCEITATDAPAEHAVAAGWQQTGQFAASVENLRRDRICDPKLLRQRVEYRTVDMNAIPSDLRNYDFNWSACCFEHLGSLEHGLQFVRSCLETLRPGGIAVHTTEFNLSSDTDTLESAPLSVYRKRDLRRLVSELRAEGHEVDELRMAPAPHYLDSIVDLPPYTFNPHLKLELAGYACTSVGLVIRRSR